MYPDACGDILPRIIASLEDPLSNDDTVTGSIYTIHNAWVSRVRETPSTRVRSTPSTMPGSRTTRVRVRVRVWVRVRMRVKVSDAGYGKG